MVRKYVRKTDRPHWSKQQLEEAVEAVKSNRMSGYEAAKRFQIPRTTIKDHVTGRRGQKSNRLGKPTALHKKVEEKLANSLHVTEKNGFRLSHTSEFPEPVASSVEVEVQTQQVPEPHQTRLESPMMSQPARSRRCLRKNRPSLNSNSTSILPTRIDREWAKELEKNRVRAENKMADATLMIAEAVKKIAEASLINAETNRMNAETNRKQLEFMKAIIEVQPSSARLRAVRQLTALATGVSETAVRQILKEQEGRNADKRQEPPEKRHRARKRCRQTDSSSEDSSDDNGEDNAQSNCDHDEEPEIEVGPAAVKIEPSDIEVHKEQAQTDPISLNVKTTTWW